MKKIKLLLLVMLCSPVVGSAQNWTPLPLKFDWNAVFYVPDHESDSMFIIGLFHHVNGIAADVVKWDGDSGITYMNLFNRSGGYIDDITTYQDKIWVSAGGIIYRKDDTGFFATNDVRYRQAGGFVRFGDRLVTMTEYREPGTGWLSMHWDVWDGMQWKDTLRYDTLWPGDLWGASTVAWYKGELYVGGNINPGGKPQLSEILRFDGTKWKDVGGGIPSGGMGYVAQLLVWKGDLYACGSFDETQGAPGNGIARWDGTRWHRLGDGLQRVSGSGAGVRSMTVHNDELYAVGLFDHAGGMATNGIAKWDGQKWCVINDDFGGIWTSHQIVSFKNKLYISGGWYSINGDSAFNHLAKWTGGTFGDTCAQPLTVANPIAYNAVSIHPNPVTDLCTIVAPPTAGLSRIVVTGMLGDIVLNKQHDFNTSHSMRVDLTNQPAGVYLVRVQATNGNVTALKVVRH